MGHQSLDPTAEDDRSRLITYGVYTKLIEGIKHFDGIQTSYRTMASTLLLACFAVIGFFVSRSGLAVPVNHMIIIAATSLLGIVIVTALGLIDLVFQERLMIANFVEAIRLERAHSWLPQIHHNMIHHGSHHGSPTRKSIYYTGCAGALMFTLAFSLTILFYRLTPISSAVALLCWIVGIGVYAFLFSKATGQLGKIVPRLLLETREHVDNVGA